MMKRPVSAAQIAQSLDGDIISIKGSPDRAASRAAALNAAEDGTLLYLKPGIDISLHKTRMSGCVVICHKDHADALEGTDITCLITNNPRLAFIRTVSIFFSSPRPPMGIHPSAVVDPTAIVDPTASVMAGCVVGPNCRIGARSILNPNVTFYSEVKIGNDVVIHSGTVIGADGFGYERNEDGALEKFPHIGGVTIEDDVEIGSNTSIDRGTLSDTVIHTGVRIDNQCHISHNVEIGKHSAVIAQSMVGGSAKIGDYSWLAPAAIIMNQAKIGTRSTVGLGAVVVKGVADDETVMGAPAVPAAEFKAQRAALKKLMGS